VQLSEREGRALARYAREVIASGLGGPDPTPPSFPGAREPGATFVTVRRGARLQGCIGSLSPHAPLVEDVAHNANAAAFVDPRASPLDLSDVPALDVEVTVLGPLRPIAFEGEAEAIAALRPGEDGVVLSWRGHRGTLLPQVWRELPEPAEFLAHVKVKAGLPETFWADDVQLFRYAAQKYEDLHA
jgi:AmmeMemoRadiSam system protein A